MKLMFFSGIKAITFLFLLSCSPIFKNPVSNDSQVEVLRKIVGKWEHKDFVVTIEELKGKIRITELKEKGRIKRIPVHSFFNVKNQVFLNFGVREFFIDEKGFFLLLIQERGDRLMVYAVEADSLEKAFPKEKVEIVRRKFNCSRDYACQNSNLYLVSGYESQDIIGAIKKNLFKFTELFSLKRIKTN